MLFCWVLVADEPEANSQSQADGGNDIEGLLNYEGILTV